MCGILGFITKAPKRGNYDTFRRIMLASCHRGRDAAGIVLVDKEGRITTYKEPMKPVDFIQERLPAYKDQINEAVIALGHIRESTQGDPKDNENNHPVESEHWIMIHNGQFHDLPRLEGYKYVGEVDTEILISYIETKGLAEGIPYIGFGSGAIALVNKAEPNYLLLARYTSPIHTAIDEKETIIYFASEEDILKAALGTRFCFFSSNHSFGKVQENVVYKLTWNPFTVIPLLAYTAKTKPYVAYNFKDWRKEWKEDNKIHSGTGITIYSSEDEKTKKPMSILVPTIVEDSRGLTHYHYIPEERIWVDESLLPLLDIERKEGKNRYYIPTVSREFRTWDKLSGESEKGWISTDKQLFKKYDGTVRKHFIMPLTDALMEGEVTLIPGYTYIKRFTKTIRVFLDERDEILGFALLKEGISEIERRGLTDEQKKALEDYDYKLDNTFYIDIEDLEVAALLQYDRELPSSPEFLCRYFIDVDEMEENVQQVLSEEKEGEKDIKEEVTRALTEDTEACSSYVPTIGKDKVFKCQYCRNYNSCYGCWTGEGV